MSYGKTSLHRLINVVVYAPIGLVTVAQKELPQLVATGRARVDNQITFARFVGKMAIRQGKKELDRRLAEADRARDGVIEATVADEVTDLDSASHIEPVADTLPEAIIDAVAQSPILDDNESLPIEGYDSLAASQVVLRLDTLTPGELDVVNAYEEAHRARRTILGKIAQLQAK